MNIGDEAINAGIDANGFRPVHVTCCRHHIGQDPKIGEAARVGTIRCIATNALKVIALKIELLSLAQTGFGEARMFRDERVSECSPVALVLPTRIRHNPIKVIEHTGDEKACVPLRRAQRSVDSQAVFADEMGDNGFAVADRLATTM